MFIPPSKIDELPEEEREYVKEKMRKEKSPYPLKTIEKSNFHYRPRHISERSRQPYHEKHK